MERNIEGGMPPSEEIEREWQRYENDLDRRGSDAYAASVLQETAPAQISHTTAEPRPNAYIPDDIGIPKPYGALAPFKPTEVRACAISAWTWMGICVQMQMPALARIRIRIRIYAHKRVRARMHDSTRILVRWLAPPPSLLQLGATMRHIRKPQPREIEL